MNKWKLWATPSAIDEFKNLPLPVRTLIRETIRTMLKEDCPTYKCKKLRGIKNVFSKRVKQYRILFNLDTDTIELAEEYNGRLVILAVANLHDVYQLLKRFRDSNVI